MNLTCLVLDSPQPPQFIFWYHNQQVNTLNSRAPPKLNPSIFQPISYTSGRGGISQITEKGATTASFLLVTNDFIHSFFDSLPLTILP